MRPVPTTLHNIGRAFALLTIPTRWRWAGLLPLALSGAVADAIAALSQSMPRGTHC